MWYLSLCHIHHIPFVYSVLVRLKSSCFMERFNRRDTAILSQTRYFPVRLYINALNGTIKIVDTVLWPHYPNKHVFSNCWNLLYNNSASFRCDERLFHSPGPAAAKCKCFVAEGAVCLHHNAWLSQYTALQVDFVKKDGDALRLIIVISPHLNWTGPSKADCCFSFTSDDGIIWCCLLSVFTLNPTFNFTSYCSCVCRFQSTLVLRCVKHSRSGYGCEKSTSTTVSFGITCQSKYSIVQSWSSVRLLYKYVYDDDDALYIRWRLTSRTYWTAT